MYLVSWLSLAPNWHFVYAVSWKFILLSLDSNLAVTPALVGLTNVVVYLSANNIFHGTSFWIDLCLLLFADIVPKNMKDAMTWLLLLWPTNVWR